MYVLNQVEQHSVDRLLLFGSGEAEWPAARKLVLAGSFGGLDDPSMSGAGDGVCCWCCGRRDGGQESCSWCGVWLVELDPVTVPASLRLLLTPARRWGIGDDGYRVNAVEAADRVDLVGIVDAVESVSDEELSAWLCGARGGCSSAQS